MIFWASPGFKARVGMNLVCARGQSESTFSHDDIFHTLLDLLEIKTAAKKADKAIFSKCRDRRG
jgi:lipid A ethanolaminephosphotransferase